MAITIQFPSTVKTMVGTWTQTKGAANQTLSIAGTVWDARFTSNKSSGTADYDVKWSQSVSGRITTLTIYSSDNVTDGKFVLTYTPN